MKSREQELKDEIEEAENVNNEYYDSNSIEKLKAELKGLTEEKAKAIRIIKDMRTGLYESDKLNEYTYSNDYIDNFIERLIGELLGDAE